MLKIQCFPSNKSHCAFPDPSNGGHGRQCLCSYFVQGPSQDLTLGMPSWWPTTARGVCFQTQIAWHTRRGWYLCRFSVVRWVSAITRAVFPTFFWCCFLRKILSILILQVQRDSRVFFCEGTQNSLTSSGLPSQVDNSAVRFFFVALVTLINHSEFDPISRKPAMKGSTKWTILRCGSAPKNVWNLDIVRLAGMWWDYHQQWWQFCRESFFVISSEENCQWKDL